MAIRPPNLQIDKDEVRHCFDYDRAKGVLVWKDREDLPPHSRATLPGKVAGTTYRNGYVGIVFRGRAYLAHRLIWAFHYGEIPFEIDHADGDKANNRIENLRVATLSQNRCNMPRSSLNTSGHKGVSFHKCSGKYVARITKNDIRIHLGLFPTAEEAGAVYARAAEIFHREFARID